METHAHTEAEGGVNDETKHTQRLVIHATWGATPSLNVPPRPARRRRKHSGSTSGTPRALCLARTHAHTLQAAGAIDGPIERME